MFDPAEFAHRAATSHREDMQIFVKSRTTTAVEIDEDSTVFDLKERIAPNPRDVIMSFSGKTLADWKPWSESGVKNGNTVYVTLRLRGGRGMMLEQDMQLEMLAAKLDPNWNPHDIDGQSFEHVPTFEEPNTWSQPQSADMPAMQPSLCFMSASIPTPEELISSGDDTDGEHFECGAKRSYQYAMEELYEAVPQKRHAPAVPEQPASNPLQPQRKGAAYDLDTVDEKLRKRLLKNRRSAERSRQKKNAAMKESEQALQQSQAENVELQNELEEMRTRHEEVQKQHEAMRQLLLANNILPPF